MKKYPVISVAFNRLGYKSKSGLYPLHLRIYYKRQTDYVLIDDIPPLSRYDWVGDASEGLYVTNTEINKRIREILDKARDWVHGKVLQGHAVSIPEIKEYLKGPRGNETFNQFIDRFIRGINKEKSRDEKLSFRTIQTYRSFELRLNEFRPHIRFDELTPAFAKSFERYLAVRLNLRGVTRAKHFDKFRICYRAALKQGLVKHDEKLLFDDVHIKEEKSRRVSLTMAELRILKEKVLTDPREEYFKQIFLFACLSGLYYSDIKLLKVAHIEEVELEDGVSVWSLVGERSKNGEPFDILIQPDAEVILRNHSNWPNIQAQEPLFSGLISDVKYNAKLKTIAAHVGISKSLSAKVARHTFAEVMMAIGNPVSKVGRALGHTKSTTTDIYSRQSRANALSGWKTFKL